MRLAEGRIHMISSICAVGDMSSTARASLTVWVDWLVKNGLKGEEKVEMPDDVAVKTIDRYKEAWRSIVGKGWDAAAAEEAAA